MIVATTTVSAGDDVVNLASRGESGQSHPFWIFMVAATGILAAVIFLVWLTHYWIKPSARRRRRRLTPDFFEPAGGTTTTTIASDKPVTKHLKSTADQQHIQTDVARTAMVIMEIESSEAAQKSPTTTATAAAEATSTSDGEEPAGDSNLPKRKKKKKNSNHNNGTHTSGVFTSIGRKSVASVQWVSFRGSMDLRPQQSEQRLHVVNLDDRI